jgi:hypothetical protein
MAATMKAKKAPAPADVRATAGMSLLTGKGVASSFTLRVLEADPEVALLAVELSREGEDGGESYHIHKDTHGVLHCDCADGTFVPERPGGCKHIAGLRQQIKMFAALGGMLGCPTGDAPAWPAKPQATPAAKAHAA